MKFTRDTWLALGLLFTLIIMMSIVALGQRNDQTQLPALTSISNGPNGALALKLWLRQMNYTVLDDALDSFELPEQAKIVLVLEPALFQEEELSALDRWVKAGGTLIAAGDVGMLPVAEHFDFKLTLFNGTPEKITFQSPLFLNPVIQTSIPVPSAQFQPMFYFVPSRSSYVTYLSVEGKPVLASFDMGKGRVILSSISYPFSNIGLKQAGNPALLLNLLGYAKEQGPIWFDEWHHGFRGAGNAVGPDNWLRYTALGRSILFVALVIFLALLFQGRAFGRPVPLPHELKRRGALEHVTAMANLGRLAGHHKFVLLQYRHELKRTLGRRYRLDPTLPDSEYVASLLRYNPAIDGPALLALLARLQQTNSSENEMVNAAAEAAKWIKE